VQSSGLARESRKDYYTMATNTATVKYASRSAVSGSNAYDLSRIREYTHESEVPERAPANKPAVKPAVRPNPAVRQQPKAVTRSSMKTAQKTYSISLLAVIGFVVVGVMMVFVLLAHVKYNEVTSNTVKLQATLKNLTEQERKLKIQYEDAFDVNDVEQYATNVLGMSKPEDSQVSTLKSAASDKAIVVNAEKDNTTATESMATFLASLVAYFK
jgi:hypothetical protein